MATGDGGRVSRYFVVASCERAEEGWGDSGGGGVFGVPIRTIHLVGCSLSQGWIRGSSGGRESEGGEFGIDG